MNKKTNQNLFLIISTLFVFSFIFSFAMRSCGDSLFSTFSLAFNILGSLATVVTLAVAISLYDRFGLNAKLIEKSVENVLKLKELLNAKKITVATSKEIDYVLWPGEKLGIDHFEQYEEDSKKLVLISSEEYNESMKEILAFINNRDIPLKIKNKMEFLQVIGLGKLDNAIEEYVILHFIPKTKEDLNVFMPEITFEGFKNNLEILMTEIENWLKNPEK